MTAVQRRVFSTQSKTMEKNVKVMQQRQTEPRCHAEPVINRLETAERINTIRCEQLPGSNEKHKGQVQPGNATERWRYQIHNKNI